MTRATATVCAALSHFRGIVRPLPCLVVLGLLQAPQAFAAHVFLGNLENQGGLVYVPVLFDAVNDQVASLQFEVHFAPDSFSLIGVAPGPAAVASGKDVAFGARTNHVRVIVAGLNSDPLASGYITAVQFEYFPNGVDRTLRLANVVMSDAVGGSVVNLRPEDSKIPPPAVEADAAPEQGGEEPDEAIAATTGDSVVDEAALVEPPLALNGFPTQEAPATTAAPATAVDPPLVMVDQLPPTVQPQEQGQNPPPQWIAEDARNGRPDKPIAPHQAAAKADKQPAATTRSVAPPGVDQDESRVDETAAPTDIPSAMATSQETQLPVHMSQRLSPLPRLPIEAPVEQRDSGLRKQHLVGALIMFIAVALFFIPTHQVRRKPRG